MIELSTLLSLVSAAAVPMLMYVIKQLATIGAAVSAHEARLSGVDARLRRHSEDIAALRTGAGCPERIAGHGTSCAE